MEKFKNALKSVNKFGLVLILAAAGIIFSQSAFKSKKAMVLWGKDSTVPSVGWRNLTGIAEDNGEAPHDPNTYRCVSNLEQICTAEFEDSTPPTSPSSIPDGDTNQGEFIYNP
ncbi:hypothetical protein [Pedobacter insulae]|uniref:Uncharacterized protein n=1 Tax=Pedobacter insulae TaxID=414048 RepID=A0A1I2WZS7_9SPHI|nr:hypothetical protein [Pedobacter insulae]SFH05171.1 hypothetical protein SAMN04489864_104305 [Pedobacter insulae]